MSKLPQKVVIGREGEQYSREIVLDVSCEKAMWEDAVPSLFFVRPTESTAYPVAIEIEGNFIKWLPNAYDTQIPSFVMDGKEYNGKLQVVFTIPAENNGENTVIGKSGIIDVAVRKSLTVSQNPPEPYEEWLTSLLDAASRAETASEEAQGYAQDAETAKDGAETAQTKAEQAQGLAEDAMDASLLAQTKAETAQDKAEVAQGKAELAQERAEQAQEYAESAKDDAVQAKTDAQSARDLAQGYATSAGQSATIASNKAQDARGYAQQTALDAQATGADRTAVTNAVNGFDQKVLIAEGAITDEGTRQIGLVNSAGTTQITAIETKINTFAGIEILDEGESPQHESTEVTLTPDAEEVDQIPQIDDTQLSDVDTWSSNKIHAEDCFEVSASGSVVTVNDGADNVPIKSMTVQIVAQQSGSGDPSPSNVRPISGYTDVVVHVTGKNLINPALIEYGYINADGGNSGASGWSRTKYIEIEPNTTYTFSVDTTAGSNAKHAFYDSTETFISAINSGSATFTTPSNAKYIRLSFRTESTTEQLEAGSTATAYEPYVAPVTTTIDLPSEAGTVYGGTLTINENGSAVLAVDKIGYDMGDLSWTKDSGGGSKSDYLFKHSFAGIKGANNTVLNSICSIYKAVQSTSLASLRNDMVSGTYMRVNSSSDVMFKDTNYNVASDFETAVTGQKLVIPFTEPLTYSFTVDPNLIKTLYGTNIISANTGDISITYRADKKLYVDTRLAELRALIGG